MDSTMASKEYNLHVMMFPWLAHGHVTPLLELAKKLSHYNFYITICSSPINLLSVEEQICTKTFPSIQFVELHLPSNTDLLPHYQTTKSCPPHLMSTLKEAYVIALESSSDLLTSLKPDLLIYDFVHPMEPDVASKLDIPAVFFITTSAAASSYVCHMLETPMVPFPFPAIYYQEEKFKKMIQSSNGTSTTGGLSINSIGGPSSVILIKTYTDLEAKYIEHFSYLFGKEVLPVGALVQEEPPITTNNDNDDKKLDYFMSWLDKKDKCSVVFVAFGTEYFMPREEIEEIAYGLELSGVSFIWVIRFHKGEEVKDLEQVLPHGFLNRIGERGMVVRGWAPQVKILEHGSIGGFVSHCGWSSVLESLRYAVPLIAMPMHIDQPLNARLVVELGVGLEVKRRDERKIDRGEMAKVIKEVVMGNRGEELKRRMKEIRDKTNSGGDIDLVVEKLMKLCGKSCDHRLWNFSKK